MSITPSAVALLRDLFRDTTKKLVPGDRYQFFDEEYGFMVCAGTIVGIGDDEFIATRDGREGHWKVPANGCRPAVVTMPLDPSITDPFSVGEGWQSDASRALREQCSAFDERSRDWVILSDLRTMQDKADHAALAALVPVTACPEWCDRSGHHTWDPGGPGNYYRTHEQNSAVFGSSIQLTLTEKAGQAEPVEPMHISIDRGALYSDGDGLLTLDNVAVFVAELQRLAVIADGAR